MNEINESENDEILFKDLGLDEKTLRAVELKGFKIPSPIQILAIPRLLSGDANLIAKARTGTGKTAAFGLPLVQKITEKKDIPQALVLTPTRELCLQVCKEIESFATSSFPRMVACYGGQGMTEQIRSLKRGSEIVVGTPGRVQDLMEKGVLDISKIDYFILDEADEMLDMGFIDDIKAIFSKANPDSRILLFSATMPKEILQIASEFMGDYEIVEEEKKEEEPLLTEQRYWFVRENEKIESLVRLIDVSPDFYGLVFTQTKIDADNVSRQLEERGYDAAALHGDIAQSQREKILWRFRNRKTKILVATDVAARGIDIEGLTHVVNYALPFDGPTYIHRIGRTGRAGKTGIAYTFVRPDERRKLEFIKKASFKATKGEMKMEKIPSVEDVLKIKKEQLFEQTKQKLSLLESDEISTFESMAQQLCEQKEPIQVVSELLAITYGKELDKNRYGNITKIESPSEKNRSRGRGNGRNFSERDDFAPNSNQVRLYVQLGRMDGHNVRSIADYFSKLLNIPQHFVDKIDLSEKFTLVNLPRQAGMDLLNRSKKDNSLPHMHIDVKVGGKSGRGGDKFGRSTDFGGDNFRGERGFSDKKKSGFQGKREGGKKPLHVSKKNSAQAGKSQTKSSGQANLYKK